MGTEEISVTEQAYKKDYKRGSSRCRSYTRLLGLSCICRGKGSTQPQDNNHRIATWSAHYASHEQDFMKKRLPRLLAYQNKMVRRSTSLLAMTTAEHEDICQTGMRAATRIETLETADGLLSVYRKALDSYYYNYITNEEKAFVSEAVRKAELPKETENLSFRRIFLYAWDEDVMPQLLEATNEQDIAMPPVPDIEKLSRYKNKKAKQRGALIDVNASVKKIKIPTTQQTEYAAVMLINKAASIGLKQLTLRHWLELNQLLHNVDFNEDVVAKELKRLGLKKNTRKIQKTLAKYYALPEGYNIF
jgi:hypothetical protein